MKIVIIDDDRLVRDTLLNYLDDDEFDAVGAVDGQKGLELVAQHNPDVVVTDILMPNKEGMETITELKKGYPDIGIVAISGQNWSGFTSYLDMASRLGAHAVLSKPFTRKDFIKTIRGVVEAKV
jgi:YesN/AraC family two-component response regulator